MLPSDDVIFGRIQTSSLFVPRATLKFIIWDVVSVVLSVINNNNVER